MVNKYDNNIGVDRAGFGSAFAILIIYFMFEYIRPQDSLLPVLSYIRIPMLLSLVLFVIFLKSDKEVLKDRLVMLTMFYIAEIGVSVIYAINTTYVWRVFWAMTIILLAVILVMPGICNSRAKLAKFFDIWILIHVFVAIYSLLHSGHGPGGFLLDENDLSLTLNMVLPIAIYRSLSPNITSSKRLYYRLMSLLFIISIGATVSRGGFLGLLAVFGLIWLFSENKLKSFFQAFMLIAVLAFPAYKMIPETFVNEMLSITNTEDDTRQERMYFWTKGWEMFVDNPILGVGANNYPWNIAQYQLRDPEFDPRTMLLFGGRPAHSLYFTLIPELGLVGIILFLLILHQIFKKLNDIVRSSKNREARIDDLLLAKAIIVSTVTFLVTGTFISVLYYPPFWYIIGFTLTMHNVMCSEDNDTVENVRPNR